jgi:hypothetical protein
MPRFTPYRHHLGLAGSLILMLSITACAGPERWVNPDASSDQSSLDRNYCQQRADHLASRQLDIDQASNRNIGTTDQLSQDMAIADARKLRQRLYANCLGARGYQRKGN